MECTFDSVSNDLSIYISRKLVIRQCSCISCVFYTLQTAQHAQTCVNSCAALRSTHQALRRSSWKTDPCWCCMARRLGVHKRWLRGWGEKESVGTSKLECWVWVNMTRYNLFLLSYHHLHLSTNLSFTTHIHPSSSDLFRLDFILTFS